MAPPQQRDRIGAGTGRRAVALGAAVAVIAFGAIIGAQSIGSAGVTPSVDAGPSMSPGRAQRWTSTVTDGLFTLRLEGATSTFRSDEPMDIVATLLYQGPEDGVALGFAGLGPIAFTIPGILLPPAVPPTCTDVEIGRDAPVSTRLSTFGEDDRFLLPHGLRRISATANLRIGGCGGGQKSLETSIVVAVIDDDEDLPIWTDPQRARACPLNRLSARVALHPDDGFGFIDTAGKVHGVEWPPGFSARHIPGGPLLFGPDGEVIAQEGDVLVFSGTGAVAADRLIHPCFLG